MSGYTPGTWADALLHLLGVPDTKANRNAIVAWEAAEGGNWHNTAHYNPLNTTLTEPGATSMNSVGVKAYTSWDEGLRATVATLRAPAYAGIRSALKKGNDAPGVLDAITSSSWGTHSISLSGKSYTGGSGGGSRSGGSKSGGGSMPWYDYLSPAGAAAWAAGHGASSAASSAASGLWNDVKPFFITLAFAGLGLGLIGMGVVKTTAPARKTITQDAGVAAKTAEVV